MSNQTYDILKWIARYLLPATGTLYFTLTSIWGLPYGEQIVGTITALTAFLGVLLGLSDAEYNKQDHSDGTLEIDTENWEVDKYKITLETALDDIKHKDEIVLKVDPHSGISQDKHAL